MTAEQAETLKRLAKAARELDAFKPKLTRAEALCVSRRWPLSSNSFDGPPLTLWGFEDRLSFLRPNEIGRGAAASDKQKLQRARDENGRSFFTVWSALAPAFWRIRG
jgi:hypothetical protein